MTHLPETPVASRRRPLRASLLLCTLACLARGEHLASELQALSSKPTSCVYQRAYGMYGVYCGGLKLSNLPDNLKTSIEILDASDNKIRELTDDSFISYTNIKYLYLEDNSIYNVEENALKPLAYMETLDLSQNAITTIPNTIFNLPSLRKLQLRGNPLIHWSIDLASLQKPIKAPLVMLDISDCKLTGLPDVGILPELKIYNVSNNPLARIQPQTFAQTCKLTKVDLSRSLDNIHVCSLRPTVNWLSDNGVYFVLEDYTRLNSNEFNQCPDFPDDGSLNITKQQCKCAVTSSPVYRTSRQTWLTVTAGLAGFLVGFMLLLYLAHRRNVAHTGKTNKPQAKCGDRDGALLSQE